MNQFDNNSFSHLARQSVVTNNSTASFKSSEHINPNAVNQNNQFMRCKPRKVMEVQETIKYDCEPVCKPACPPKPCADPCPKPCMDKRMDACMDPCADPCADPCKSRHSWVWYLVWFFVVFIIVFFILYAIKPVWVQTKDDSGNPTGDVDFGKILITSIIVAIIILIIIWIFRSIGNGWRY